MKLCRDPVILRDENGVQGHGLDHLLIGISTLILGVRWLVCKQTEYDASMLSENYAPASCMSEVQRVRLSRSNCMMSVESL